MKAYRDSKAEHFRAYGLRYNKKNIKRIKAYRKRRWVEAKDVLKAKWYARSATLPGTMMLLVAGARCRARRSGLRCDLTKELLVDLFRAQNGRCALTGREMTTQRAGERPKTSISVDRIVPAEGYTIRNVRLVCAVANYMRYDMTDDELVDWCKAIISNRGQANG